MSATYDYAAIAKMVTINRHRMDEELELQAHIAEVIGRQLAQANAHYTALKEALATAEAQAMLDVREGGEKLTADEAKARVTINRTRQGAFNAMNVAKQTLEQWVGLQDAWRQRSYALKNLAELYGADYWVTTTTSYSDSAGSRRDKVEVTTELEQRRAAIRDATRGRGTPGLVNQREDPPQSGGRTRVRAG